MSRDLGLSQEYLAKLAATASYRYKTYTIKKKSGGRRKIHHPARELKLIQGWLVENVFSRFPVHQSATAYKPGASIRANASLHVGNSYLLRVDFKDFFPSLTRTDVIALLQAHQQHPEGFTLTVADIKFIAAIVCCGKALTIGAPSSPVLSNAIMFDFDGYWSSVASRLGVTYSRYADDLYFSTNEPHVLDDLLSSLTEWLGKQLCPSLHINRKKTVFTSRKHLRRVTGLVLTSDRKISIGRKKKRFLKSMIFRLLHGELDISSVTQLEGWIAYVRSVEPTFVRSLENKYNIDLLVQLKREKNKLN